MKDLKPLLYVLLLPFGIISVLFIITLFAVFTGNSETVKDLLSMTGTLGDTLGGITTCLIGGITLYYIISTFRDQNSINQHTKSANNFGIFYDSLSRIEKKISIYESNFKIFQNSENYYYKNIDNFWKNIGSCGFYELSLESDGILADIHFLIKYIENSVFDSFHRDFLKNDLKYICIKYLNITENNHDGLQMTLRQIKNNPEILEGHNSFIQSLYGNKLIRLLINIQTKLHELVELGYFEKITISEYIERAKDDLSYNESFQFDLLEQVDFANKFDYARPNYSRGKNRQ